MSVPYRIHVARNRRESFSFDPVPDSAMQRPYADEHMSCSQPCAIPNGHGPDRDTYRAWAVTRCTSLRGIALRGIALRGDVSHRNGRLQSWGPRRNPGHRRPETPIRHSTIRIMSAPLPIRNPAPSRHCHSTSSDPHASNQISPWMTS